MYLTKIVSSKTLERLKQRARKLKREKSIPHTQALEETAQSIGFENWHQVVLANQIVAQAETALFSGCVLAFEWTDTPLVDTDDGVIIEDAWIGSLVEDKLFDMHANSIDEFDPLQRPLKETLSTHELRESFDPGQYLYYRLHESHANRSLTEILNMVQERCFWMPVFLWHKGKLVSTYDFPALDDKGNVAGVRF